MTDKRHHRILIQVADQEIDDESVGSVTSTMQRPNKLRNSATRPPSQICYADIDIKNCTTLSMSKKDQQNRNRTTETMCFDCVARTDSDPLIRNELGNLFDMLLIDQQSCCLIQFKPLRVGPSNFFNNILIPEIDRRIMLLRSTFILQSIRLEYYDVQKYDVVNMLQNARKIGSNTSRTAKSDIVFRNTRELLRWTQHAFVSLWASGSEHDCFELEFVFVDAPNELDGIPMGNKKIKAKLSILQFYMNKMDGNMRVGIQKFFENMNQNSPRIKQSIITDYLREYFLNERESWLIWMIFDVPQINYGSSLVNDMLTIAKNAYKGDRDNNTLMNNFDDISISKPQEKSAIPRQTGGVHYPSSYRKLQTSNNSFNCNVSNNKMGNYSLSFWYCHIDQSLLNVIASMERYYDRKYDLKVQKMCNDLKYTTRYIDNNLHYTPKKGFSDDRDIEDDKILKNLLKQYREALSEFRILLQKVERTKYGDQLSVFMDSKNNEIIQQTRKMKIRLLEICQVRLSNAIKDEVKTLKSDESLSSNISGFVTKTTKKF